MCMSALPQTHPIITPLWLNKTTTHTNIRPLFYPLVEFMVPFGKFLWPNFILWSSEMIEMCVCVESLLKVFPADFTFHYCLFWLSFSRPSASLSKTPVFVCVSGVRVVWTCCLSVAQVTVCSVTLLSERVISACSSSKIQPSIKRWRSARRFSKCMWQKKCVHGMHPNLGHSMSNQPNFRNSDFVNIFFWRKTNINGDESQNIKCNGCMLTE